MTRKILSRSVFLFLLFSIPAIKCLAVGDTLFLDKDWKKCDRVYALYYRLSFKSDSLRMFIVKDYYMNGNLQMEAVCTEVDPPMKNGKCTFYYENGQRSSQGEFYNNNKVGGWIYYSETGRYSKIENFDQQKDRTYCNASWRPQNQSSLFIANVNYRYKLNKSALSSGRGLGLELGFNFGYFFSQKLLLAVYGAVTLKDNLWNTSYNENYLRDFNSNFNGTSLVGNDSIIVNYYSNLINSDDVRFHDASQHYGLMIRLPFTYAPIIKIYKGLLFSSYRIGSSHQPAGLQPIDPERSNYSEHIYYDIERKINWGIEIFLYNGRSVVKNYDPENHVKAKNKELRWITNKFGLSAYFEMIDSYHSTFLYDDGVHHVSVPFEAVMSQTFMQKYKTDYNFGLRLSFGIF